MPVQYFVSFSKKVGCHYIYVSINIHPERFNELTELKDIDGNSRTNYSKTPLVVT